MMSSYARAQLRSMDRSLAILRARLPGVSLPEGQDFDEARRWLASRRIAVPAPPPQPGLDPAVFTRAVSGTKFVALGVFAAGSAVALAIHTVRSGAPDDTWTFVALLAVGGAAAIALGRWIDRVAKRAQPKRPVT
jgi:hypothetical protein